MKAAVATASAPWARIFQFDPAADLPLYVQLRRVMVAAILDGRLVAGTSMPSSRDLAQALGLSRNTVTAAYEHLVEEGLLEAQPRKGLFVRPEARLPGAASPSSDPFRPPGPVADNGGPGWNQRILRSVAGRRTLVKPEGWQDYPYQFVYGTFDPKLFPTEDFRECCARSLTRVQLPQWTPDLERADVPALVDQIRQRLLPRRGVFARADEILITVGSQHAFYLLADALFDEHTRVGLEEPGHPHARNSFAVRNPLFSHVPVDDEGVLVDTLPALDYLYVTPSHQSPTTRTLSLERRQWLIRKAELQDTVLIEDDYESENLYEGSPMPALKSLDQTGRVIYIGSLSKSLSPAVRLGYIVAPAPLLTELRALRHAMVRHPSAFLQHAYALFISLGHHDSYSRRLNAEMRQRLEETARALRSHLPQVRFSLPHGGASIWVELPAHVDGAALAAAARDEGVLVEPGNVFFAVAPQPCPFIRLRLSSIHTGQVDPGIRALGRALARFGR